MVRFWAHLLQIIWMEQKPIHRYIAIGAEIFIRWTHIRIIAWFTQNDKEWEEKCEAETSLLLFDRGALWASIFESMKYAFSLFLCTFIVRLYRYSKKIKFYALNLCSEQQWLLRRQAKMRDLGFVNTSPH